MAGRGMRARAPVSYNDKNPTGMVPAWLKTIQPNVNDPPVEPKRRKKVSKSKKEIEASSEKENTSNVPSGDVTLTVKSKGPQGKSKGRVGANPPHKKIKEKNKGPKKAVAARGRNAGLKIVPIGTCALLTFRPTSEQPDIGPCCAFDSLIEPYHLSLDAKFQTFPRRGLRLTV